MMIRTRLAADRSGTAALEFALIGLPFILLLLGVIEFGRSLHIRTALDQVADRAQRAILIDPDASSATLDLAIRSAFSAGPPDRLGISYATETQAGVTYRLVTIAYPMDLLLPAPLGRSIPIGSTRRVLLP